MERKYHGSTSDPYDQCAYNLQGSLSTFTPVSGDPVTCTYDPAGVRVSKQIGTATPATYLIDPFNHTGYAQTLEETSYAGDGQGGWTPVGRIQYTIGDDVISQTRSTWVDGVWVAENVNGDNVDDTEYLLYDGHGSTRQLVRHALLDLEPLPAGDGVGETPDVVDSYSYDGYGVMLSSGSGADAAASAGTSLLYTGEHYDSHARQYYLRARYYDPANGRFNRVDPYAGNPQDPQSLHKYLYCHANPVSGIDPAGMMTLSEITVVVGVMLLLFAGVHHQAHYGTQAKERLREQVAGTQAITYLGPELHKQMSRDMLETEDKDLLNMNFAFWKNLGEANKTVTYQSLTAEKRLLQAIDIGYHSLEVADIATGAAGLATGMLFSSKIVWGTTNVHGSPDHMHTIVRNTLARQLDPDVKSIYVHKHLTEIMGGPISGKDYMADWVEVLANGKLNIFEVRSPDQRYNYLLRKGWDFKKMLGDKLNRFEIVEIGQNVF